MLGDDNSSTNKLIFERSTAGHADVYVNNKQRSDGQTINGIQVIEVDGVSAETFCLVNRVVAWAYVYKRQQGASTVNDGYWYLRVPIAIPDSSIVPVRS